MELPVHIGDLNWFREERRKDNDRQAVFPTPTIPFGNDPEEDEPHDDFTVPQKVPHVTQSGNTTKMPYIGYECQERRINDWNSGRRRHLQS